MSNINGYNTINDINDAIITNSSTSGSFNIKCDNGEYYDLQAPTAGIIGDVLQKGVGDEMFFGPGSALGSGVVYSGTLPIPAGQHITINTLGTQCFQSRINEGLTDLDIDGLNITDANIITTNSLVKTGGTDNQYLLADGTIITQSLNTINSNYYLLKNSSVVLNNPPPLSNIGEIQYDTPLNLLTANLILINDTSTDNINIGLVLTQLRRFNEIYIQDVNSSAYVWYYITATPSFDLSLGLYVDVSLRASEGVLSNTAFVKVGFFTSVNTIDTDITTLNTKTQNQTAIAGTTTFSGAGGVLGDKFEAPLFDRTTAGALSLGTSANTTSINIGNDAIGTIITGARTNISTRVNAPLHDRQTAGALSIGTSANSTSINIGNDAIITTITGASTNVSARVNAPIYDVATAGTLSIGTSTATAISIGSGSIITTYPSTGGIVATKYDALQPSTSFLKGNGTFDTSTYLTSITATNSPFVHLTNFVGTADVTIANTTAITTLWGAGSGSLTLTDVLGQSRKLFISGKLSLLIGDTLTLRYWPNASGSISAVNITAAATLTNVSWCAEVSYTIRGTDTYYCTTKITYSPSPATTIINTNTQSRTLGTNTHDFTATFSLASASNSITQTEMLLYSTYV